MVASHHLALVCGLAHGGGYAVTQRGLKVQVVRTGNGERLTEVTQPGLEAQIVDPLVVALARLGGLKVQIVDPGNRERLTWRSSTSASTEQLVHRHGSGSMWSRMGR